MVASAPLVERPYFYAGHLQPISASYFESNCILALDKSHFPGLSQQLAHHRFDQNPARAQHRISVARAPRPHSATQRRALVSHLHFETAECMDAVDESRKQTFQLDSPALQQNVRMTALRDAAALERTVRIRVAVDHDNLVAGPREHARRAHPGQASANHNRRRMPDRRLYLSFYQGTNLGKLAASCQATGP